MNKTTILIVGSVLVIAGVTGYYLYKWLLPDAVGVTPEDRETLKEITIE